MQATSRRVELATGLCYHLLEWNRKAEHTVLLVHGFLDSSWGWKAVAEAGLAEHFHVIAPDMRGHGDSDRVGAGGYYHFFDYVADLHSLMESVAHDRVSLVGHSMGGTICGYYAGSFPQRLQRLALLEGMGPPESSTPLPDRVAQWISGWRKAQGRPARSYDSIEAAAQRLLRRDPQLAPALARQLAEKCTRAGEGGGRSFKHDPLHLSMGPYPFSVDAASQFWRRISCPVLLVEGSESAMRLSESEALRRETCIATRKKATLEGAGHMVQRHQPSRLAELLLPFLQR